MLVFLALIWLAIRSSAIQTLLVNQLAQKVEEKYGGQLEIGSIKLRFPKRLLARDVLLRDQLGDTLVFLPELKAGINKINIDNRVFEMGRIRLKDPYVQILEDPGGGFNYDFVLEMITPGDSVPKGIFLKSPLIKASNARIIFKNFAAQRQFEKFNPQNFEVKGLDINLFAFVFNPDSIAFRAQNIKFSESSGFNLDEMDGEFVIRDKQLQAGNVKLRTGYSLLNVSRANFIFPSKNPEISLIEQLDVNLIIDNQSYIGSEDIGYFYSNPEVSLDRINLGGEISLTPEMWVYDNASVYIGDWFGLEGHLRLTGPADPLNAFYNSSIDTLWMDVNKAKKSYPLIFVDTDTLDLPFELADLGTFFFTGFIDGKHRNFVAEGEFNCPIGAFDGYLSVTPSAKRGILDIHARYRASLIHLDQFMNLETGLGLVSADGRFDGTWDGDTTYSIKVESVLPFIQWNNYYYTNVNLVAIVQHNFYEAAITVNDDNVNMDFSGKVDLRNEMPSFDIDMFVENANLFRLNLIRTDTIAELDLNLHAYFSGKEIDDIQGQLWIEDSRFANSRGEIPLREINLEVGQEFNRKKIVLVSEYVDGRMYGDIYLDNLLGQLYATGARFLPIDPGNTVVDERRLNDFSFNLNFKNPRPLAEVLASDFIFKENTQLSGFFRYGGKELQIEGNSPQFLIAGKQFTDLKFRLYSFGSDMEFWADLDRIDLDQSNKFKTVRLNGTLLPGIMETSLKWRETDSIKYMSEVNPSIKFEPGKGILPRLIVEMPNSSVFIKEKLWVIDDSRIEIDKKYFRVDNLLLSSQEGDLLIDGIISDVPGDTLWLDFNAVDLDLVNQFSAGDDMVFTGLVDGEAKIFNFYDGGLFLADLTIDEFGINGEKIGFTEVRSQRAENGEDVLINVLTRRGDISTFQMDGRYSPATDSLDFVFNLDKLRLNLFDPFLDPVLSDIKGIASGNIRIGGTRKNPLLGGEISVQKGSFIVDYLNTRYTFTHTIAVRENAFAVENLVARDSLGNEAIVNGGIFHRNFKNMTLDFRINANNLLMIDTEEVHGNEYWGEVYATGFARIRGPFGGINIDVSARTSGNSQFYIPVSEQGTAGEINFITYVEREDPDEDPDLITFGRGSGRKGYNADLTNIEVDLDLDITPEVEAFIIFDAQVGNVLRARGTGNLQLAINTLGSFSLNGDFNIDTGEYLFTLQNLPIKRFAIEPGSNIKFTGQVDEARMDIDAVYNTKAALYDLLLEESDELTERVPVTCHLMMKGMLENPDLSFAINLPPNSDDVARSQLESLTEDEIKKQLFSLLILNRFQPLPGLNSGSNTRSYGSAGLATSTAVLSSQLNYWLSQISNDFDIGFNYRPGDQITSDEVEVALSTQILDNRMSINLNGNVDMRSSQDKANQLVGDVEVEYNIRPSGKVRVKAFNRSNDRLIYEYSPYTQGIGLFFREEFDTLGELLEKYKLRITGRENSDIK